MAKKITVNVKLILTFTVIFIFILPYTSDDYAVSMQTC